jgi:hypothetical protein
MARAKAIATRKGAQQDFEMRVMIGIERNFVESIRCSIVLRDMKKNAMLIFPRQSLAKRSRIVCHSLVLTVGIVLCGGPTNARQGGGNAANDLAKMIPPLEESGYQQIFDGKTLTGWDADPDFWRVQDGTIVGETRIDHQPKQNTFCVWKGGQPADFDLRLEYRLTGTNDGNSGIQYRSIERPDIAKYVLQGYQADIDLKQTYTGQIYEERSRGFLSLRGQLTYIGNGQKPALMASVGDNEQLKSLIKPDDWNEVEIVARGNTLIHIWNGRVMSETVDDDSAKRKASGVLGIQVHRLPNAAMKIEVRHIRLKLLQSQ